MIISSPCTHLSGAISFSFDSGCWCIKPGCKAEPTDPVLTHCSVIAGRLPRFIECTLHLTGFCPLGHVACFATVYCLSGVRSVLDWKVSGNLDLTPMVGWAVRLAVAGMEGSAHLDSLPLVSVGRRIPWCFERKPEGSLGVQQPCCPFNLCCPKPCCDNQGAVEIRYLASDKTENHGFGASPLVM